MPWPARNPPPPRPPAPRSFITIFVTLFAVVIAVTKDLPDVEGDRANGIQTFATRLGVRNTSLAGAWGGEHGGAVVPHSTASRQCAPAPPTSCARAPCCSPAARLALRVSRASHPAWHPSSYAHASRTCPHRPRGRPPSPACPAAVAILLANYGVAMRMALTPSLGFRPEVMLTGHALLAVLLVVRARKLEVAGWVGPWRLARRARVRACGRCMCPCLVSRLCRHCAWQRQCTARAAQAYARARCHVCRYTRSAILGFYQWIWTLFYLEYAMFPFI